MFELSLHHLTALDAAPHELIGIAADNGCTKVSLFTCMQAPYRDRYPMVDSRTAGSLAGLMREFGVECHSLEVFPLVSRQDWGDIRTGLDLGARLGARYATVHSHLEDGQEAARQLAQLAEIAAEYGIVPAVEFNPFSKCASLEDALALTDAAAVPARPVSLVLDMLHAARCGVLPADIARAAPRIAYAQLSDAPLIVDSETRWREAIAERLLPGEGSLPLREMLAALQPGTTVDVEVPRAALGRTGVGPAERCKQAISASRALLAAVEKPGERLQ